MWPSFLNRPVNDPLTILMTTSELFSTLPPEFSKDLVPEMLIKKEEWNQWKDRVEDYIEALRPGMQLVAKEVAAENQLIGQPWFNDSGQGGW